MSIYLGEAGPEIIDYLLENGAATTYILRRNLGLSKQTISYNLENLERLGLVERRTPRIVDKKLTRRGPKDKVWVLIGATQKSVELAHVKDLKLRNPERAKRLEEEESAGRTIRPEDMGLVQTLLAKYPRGQSRQFWDLEIKNVRPEMPWQDRAVVAQYCFRNQSKGGR